MRRTNELDEQEFQQFRKQFLQGKHVSFVFHKRHYEGIIEKQLEHSAILDFDKQYRRNSFVQDLHGKIVISYRRMKLMY